MIGRLQWEREEMDMTRNSLWLASLLLGAGLAFPAGAQDSHQHAAAKAAATPAARAELIDGEVRRVDKLKGEVTLKHGPMPKFKMPAMTMAYRLKDKAMLDQLKAGDKIKFDADDVGGAFVITRLERAK
jgi:Cu(I)/Ag(I) efflux system periplasmic protein CusF